MSSLRLTRDLLHRGLVPALCRRSIGPSSGWGLLQCSHLSASSVGDLGRTRQGQPLDPEWTEMAKKQLKGADPAEKLTWRTPEVLITAAHTQTHRPTLAHAQTDTHTDTHCTLAYTHTGCRVSMLSRCTQQTILRTWRRSCLASIPTHEAHTPQCTHRDLGPFDRYV